MLSPDEFARHFTGGGAWTGEDDGEAWKEARTNTLALLKKKGPPAPAAAPSRRPAPLNLARPAPARQPAVEPPLSPSADEKAFMQHFSAATATGEGGGEDLWNDPANRANTLTLLGKSKKKKAPAAGGGSMLPALAETSLDAEYDDDEHDVESDRELVLRPDGEADSDSEVLLLHPPCPPAEQPEHCCA